MLRQLLTLTTALLIGGSALPCPAGAQGWKAGAAKEKITPQAPMWMAGYGSRNHPSTGLLNDLWAKALVLEDPRGARVAIITLDLVGISPELAEPICAELEKRHHLERASIALCSSHTHSGPVVGHGLRSLHYDQVDDAQKQLIDRYAAALAAKIVAVVGRAIDATEPCELSHAQGTASFAANRRNNKEPDVPRLREAGQLLGPIDHDVPVLKITDPGGKIVAILFGYACHATVLDGYDWSSDYPGFAQSELEQQFPGCTALFFAGCGGDQNPLPRRKVELARQYGHELAESVATVLKGQMKPVNGHLKVGLRKIPLELSKIPTRDEIEKDTHSSDRYVAARARFYLDQLNQGETIHSTYDYPVQVWRLGSELVLVTLGGEVVVDYALRIKEQLGGANTWVAGYTNDVMAYIPSRRVLAEGGYEGAGAMVYYSLPSPWAPSVEKAILDTVSAMATE